MDSTSIATVILKYQFCVVEFQILFILCIQIVLYVKRIATSKIIEEGVVFLCYTSPV